MADTLTVIDAGDVAEVGSVARELADAYRNRVEWYRREYGDKWAEAFADREAMDVDFKRRAVTAPPDQVTFSDLADLTTVDPGAARETWQRVKREARDELTAGHRAVKAVEFLPNAWQRAQFLAIRAAFVEQWQPANGGEQLLVDMLAQTYHAYQSWMQQLTMCQEAELARHDPSHPDARFELPRVSRAEAMDQAAAMVDRFNRLFLRTLRSLRDLRRYGQQITINSPTQVNIGGQQVNVAGEGHV
jgi:hypothetical protein